MEEFGDEEGVVFGEVAAVEDEEEFAAVAEGLDVVGDAFRVTSLESGNSVCKTC